MQSIRRTLVSHQVVLLFAMLVTLGGLACKRKPLSHAQLAQLPSDTLLYKHRTVLLQGELNQQMANQIMRQLLRLQAMDATAPVTVLIDSPGGEVAAVRNIQSTLENLRVPIHTHCLQTADGLALFLLAHGARGHRTAAAGAQLSLQPLKFPAPVAAPARPAPTVAQQGPGGVQFFHGNDGLIVHAKQGAAAQGGVGGQEAESTHLKLVMYEELASDTGKSAAEIGQDIESSRRFAALEALDYGLIDRIEE